MAELLKLRQDDFVTVTINGEDLDRTPHDNMQSPASPSRKISAEAGNWTTWATSARARSSLASRSLNKARRWRNCSRSDVIMIRSEHRKHEGPPKRKNGVSPHFKLKPSLDHLIRPGEQRWRDRQAEGLGQGLPVCCASAASAAARSAPAKVPMNLRRSITRSPDPLAPGEIVGW